MIRVDVRNTSTDRSSQVALLGKNKTHLLHIISFLYDMYQENAVYIQNGTTIECYQLWVRCHVHEH